MPTPGGLSNGQIANEDTFDNAFMKSNADTGTSGKVDLANSAPESGSSVINTQKEINNLFTFLGALKNQLIGYLPTFTNSNGFTASESVFARVEALSAKLHQSTGHKHTGAAGDGPAIESDDLAGVPLRGYPIAGSDIAVPGTNSTDVTSLMVAKIPSSGTSVKGVVVDPPYNRVPLFILSGAETNDYLTDDLGNIVYGRLTYLAGVWTLTTYVDLSGVETAYALTAGQITDGIKWFYQELFNPIVDAPTYNELFFVQSDNATADVVDASSTQRGLINTLAQVFTGLKTFLSGIDVNNQNILNVLSPTALLHAANKTYVDAFGGAAFLTTTGGTTNLTISSPRDIVAIGTLTETYVLPSTSLMQVGNWWRFVNRSTQNITIQTASLGTLVVAQPHTWVNLRVASTGIELFATQVSPIYSSVDGSLNFGGFKGINVSNGTNPNDAVNYSQLTGLAVGESNSASNVGSGSNVFKQKTGVDLEFRSIIGTNNITATQNADDITLTGPSLDSGSHTPASGFETGIPAGSIKQIHQSTYWRIKNTVHVMGTVYMRNDGSTVLLSWTVPITNGNNLANVSGLMWRANASGESAGAVSKLNANTNGVNPTTRIQFDNTGISTTASDSFWSYHYKYDLT